MTTPAPQWISVTAAADPANCERWGLRRYNAEYIRRLVRRGDVEATKLEGGHEWMVSLESLRQWQAEHGRSDGRSEL
jgi:hypothetical protein